MFSHLLLQYLLYMNPEIGLHPNLITKNCYIFNSESRIRPCNRVLHNSLPTNLEICEVKSFFGDIPFTWVVNSTDIETQKILEKNNLEYKASFPGMLINLANIYVTNYDKNIKVEIIDLSDSQLTEWLNIISQTFNVQKSELLKVINLFKKKVINNSLKLYLGFYNEKSVAAGMVLQHKDVISLHWICTVAEFRNKGLGSALTEKMLLDAKNIGCKQAILLSSTLGKRIYERLGFKEYGLYKIYGN